MPEQLTLYNTFTGKLEPFEPLEPPYVGMYLCGPTVYGEPHLGHARGPVFMDIVNRYLRHLGFKVRYVRNITDVGHLLDDADDGDDKIARKARLDKVEPMEIVQKYTIAYHESVNQLNVLPPNIEPTATAHIQEQIQMVRTIIENGYAYEVNGSVYFDVLKYAEGHDYGHLSGRKIEDLIAGAGEERRSLEGQSEKRNPNDFALWKKASEDHIMKWESPWGIGFPGWHIECSAMSSKYLGEHFDIHAGGMDLLFPHHESEIAQSTACYHKNPAKYWLHNNMITINGQKMAKSLDNGILLKELFAGEHRLLNKAYSPMTLRFFLLMAHYRSTVDFSNEALEAAEKGLKRLTEALKTLEQIEASESSDVDIDAWKQGFYAVMNDDFNTPKAIAQLFEGVKYINELKAGKKKINNADLELFKEAFNTFYSEVLGLQAEEESGDDERVDGLVHLLISLRQTAKENKDYAMADKIRDELKALGVELMDSKEGSSYKLS